MTNRTEIMEQKLYEVIERLITDKKVCIFLFGSKSEFDDLCYEIVTGLKEKYSYIKRVYVRAQHPYINKEYEKYLMGLFEETYFPEKIIGAGRAVYIRRNQDMADKSRYCVAYYDCNYPLASSGTKIAYEYALKKGVEIINIAEKMVE